MNKKFDEVATNPAHQEKEALRARVEELEGVVVAMGNAADCRESDVLDIENGLNKEIGRLKDIIENKSGFNDMRSPLFQDQRIKQLLSTIPTQLYKGDSDEVTSAREAVIEAAIGAKAKLVNVDFMLYKAIEKLEAEYKRGG